MRHPAVWLRGRLLAIRPDEVSLARRGFRCEDEQVRVRLESIGAAVVAGYRAALDAREVDELARALEAVALERRGFAYEGAAMALELLDRLTPWNRQRWRALLAGPGDPHAYLVHVGAGMARARLGRPPATSEVEHDPLLGWLRLDGFGFHEGYFRGIERCRAPRFGGYEARAFDQGLGRSMWFSCGAQAARIARAIESFDASRHADLWSGIGLACAYAGGVEPAAVEALRESAGAHLPHLAQGAAFAAQARARAGNPAPHTETACTVLCGTSADEAAAVTALSLEALPADGALPAYELWRARIRERLGVEAAV